MDLDLLKTFVAVAREGSITRASQRLHLSQPAVSAHIKALEDTFSLPLFDRTARGMSLTDEGRRLLAKAEETLSAHQELLNEARRLKGALFGTLRLGAGSTAKNPALATLLSRLAERHAEVQVTLEHLSSREVVSALRDGRLDAGFYNEPGLADADLATSEVSSFRVWLVAPRSLEEPALSWPALAEQPWIYPTASGCCGRTAEALFTEHGARPTRIISVDREEVTRQLVASGTGVGLLHADTAHEAAARGEVRLVAEAPTVVKVLFARLAKREADPLVAAAVALIDEATAAR